MNVKKSENINPRWKIFSHHLLQGINATDAYLLAGYRTTNRPSAQAASARLRQHPRFATYHGKLLRQSQALSHRRTVRAIRSKLHTLDQIIHTSAAHIPKYQQHLIKTQTKSRHGGRVTHLPCKLIAIRRYLQLIGHLPLTKNTYVRIPSVSEKNHYNS